MKKTLIYDLPLRLFHWSFALYFIIAFTVAEKFGSDSPYFSIHMLSGLTLTFTVVFRLIWGFVGSKHSRFSSFQLSPTKLIGYLKAIVTPNSSRWTGHNPASSWSGLAMIGLALFLGTTGILMARGIGGDFLGEPHEIAAKIFLVVVIAHVLGIIIHTVKYRDNIGLSMIHGRKADVDKSEEIPSSRSLAGIVYLVLLVGFVTLLSKSYNPQTNEVSLLGIELSLGEPPAEEPNEPSSEEPGP